MNQNTDVGVVNFPTLGDLLDAWYEQHCTIPDSLGRRIRFQQSDWQFWCTANHYRVKEDAVWNPDQPLLAQAFTYRRSLIVAPQKTGKGPWSAAITAGEAVGPTLFAGWARAGDVYRCEDNGCSCGWYFEYEPGEPMGRRRPGPLIQLLASSEGQAGNVYGPLSTIVMDGPLSDLMAIREGFIRVLDGDGGPKSDRIDVVSSSAKSRLGQPITFAVQDEVGLYTKRNKLTEVANTQRRGLAGMGGRSIATTNAWDPSMESYAQETFESPAKDIFKFYRTPPADLSYHVKSERRKIHKHVYAGSPWVNLGDIEAEAAEMIRTDPTEAERFFGNRVVYGSGSWLHDSDFEGLTVDQDLPPDGTAVAGGFDGSMNDDWTAIKLETREGLLFTPLYGPDQRPAYWNPSEWNGEIPRGEVEAAWEEISRRYELVRVYCDPGFHDERSWESDIEQWDQDYGPDVFVPWPTNQVMRMFGALTRFHADIQKRQIELDGCLPTRLHLKNCKKLAKPGDRYILGKPANNQKIDIAVTSVLAHEAAADARAAGWPEPKQEYVFF
ncbi:hypothetical protein ACFP47_09275 [Nesterenkonia lacusekhoensis]|uniref:Terminase n=1 Tax=Nesterenkonia lacusekhoensis TaxID=150832 RepID=A0ABS4SYW6_9MICC|nr:hypothetical protein [Nesterenkonia lacusekhoensis]MBP2317391.1 hypothetical protein [Nesterenkonia lacusekhoensis]